MFFLWEWIQPYHSKVVFTQYILCEQRKIYYLFYFISYTSKVLVYRESRVPPKDVIS